MIKHLSIKVKNFVVIGGSSLIALIIMAVGWYSVNNLNESSSKIEKIQVSIIEIEKIITIHEKFAGSLSRSYSKNETFNGETDHILCALGKWYYQAKSSDKFNDIPENLKNKFSDMEISHTNLHAIAKDYKNSFNHLDRELKNIINQKEIDHLNWVKALSNSIVSQKVSTVQTDPTKCGFGKWIVDFKTNDKTIKKLLNKVLIPHNQLHATAAKIIELQKANRYAQAMNIYQIQTLPLLTDVQSIFHKIKQYINDVNDANLEIRYNIIYTVPEDLGIIITALSSYNKFLKSKSVLLINENHSLKYTVNTIMIVMLIILIIGIAVGIYLTKSIQESIYNINSVVKDMAIHSDTSTRIKLTSNDELGEVANYFNTYLDNINKGIDQDKKVVEEIAIIVEKVKNGFYNYNLKEIGYSPMINELRDNFNQMLKNTDKNLIEVRDTIISFARYNFTKETDIKNVSGTIGSLINSSKALGINVSEVMAIINKSGSQLSQQTENLASSSEELSAASIEQASSLEETAAAMEEITSNAFATAEQAHTMVLKQKVQ
jgi:methyl-accepting chemotaxis protein